MSVPRPIAFTASRHAWVLPAAWWLLVPVLALQSSAAIGQSRLGATDAAGPIAASRTTPGPTEDQPDRLLKERGDLTAARLLALARQDIAEARPEIAQRTLELLIARYPESPVAADARRELYALYGSDRQIAASPQRSPSAPSLAPPTTKTDTTLTTPAAPAEPPRTASGWQTRVVGYRRLQDELRIGVGDRIFFSAGSAALGSRARAVISAQAEWLQQRPNVDAVVEGHADDAMMGADNEKLAEARATAVRDRLLAEGLLAGRVRIEALGARDRVAICDDSDCAAQNRRAVIQVGVRGAQPADNPDSAAASRGTAVGQPR